jgi:lysophospholipase L1-like esterase
MRLLTVVALVGSTLAVSLVVSAPNAYATHFRYRSLTWERLSPAGNQVRLDLRIADRRSYHGSPDVGDAWTESVNFGDGTSGSMSGYVTSVNAIDDWFIAEVATSHTYPSDGPFSVTWQSCCTLSSLRNSPDSSLTSRTVVNLNDSNGGSPKTSVSPIVNVPAAGVQTFRLPASDIDGDNLSFRLATQAESQITQPSDLSIDSRTGVMTWNTTGKPNGLWITTVIVSDGVAPRSASSAAEAQVTFLLNLGANGGLAPSWISPPTPPDRETFDVEVGSTTELSLQASDPEGLPVTITAIGLPEGMSCTGLSQPTLNALATCQISPPSSGFDLVTFDAQDPSGVSAGARTYKIGSSQYVSLGDSFASGEGNPTFDSGTASDEYGSPPENECHRSSKAWPRVLGQSTLDLSAHAHWACSGAVTENFGVGDVASSQFNEDLQLSHLGPDTSLATIMIGGNDAGFGDVLTLCNVGGIFLGLDRCEHYSNSEVNARIDALAGRNNDYPEIVPLVDLYREAKRNAPGARIVAVGYPELFKRSGTFIGPCAGINKMDQRWMNEKTKQMNDVIQSAAASAGIDFVDVEDAFDGHHLCELVNDEWVNDRDFSDTEHSYHPNEGGHAKLAELVHAYIGDPTKLPTRVQLSPMTIFQESFQVASNLQSVTFATQWGSGDVEMLLRSPSGVVIDRDYSSVSVQHDLGPTFETYVLQDPEPGSWTIELYGADVPPGGEDVSITVNETAPANMLPIAQFELTQTGMSVSVDGSGSSDSDGSIVQYEWDFGDGTSATGSVASHTYAAAGDYTIGLAVSDDDGDAEVAFQSITVSGVSEITDDWTGANGAAWSQNWTFEGTPTSFIAEVQSGAGRLGYSSAGNAWVEAELPAWNQADSVMDLRWKPDSGEYSEFGLRQTASSGYVLGYEKQGPHFYLGRTVNGTFKRLSEYVPRPGTSTQWHRIRFEVVGNVVRAKIWVDGTAEPSSWTLSVVDDAVTGPGSAHVSVGGGSAVATNIAYFDDFTLARVVEPTPPTVIEGWRGATGSGWSGQWTFDGAPSSFLADVQSNTGRLGYASTGNWPWVEAELSAWNQADSVMQVKWKANTAGYCEFGLRQTASSGYVLGYEKQGSQFYLGRTVNGTFLRLTPYVPRPGTSTQWHRIRFEVVGDVVRAKIWVDGTAEPSSWTLSVVDDAVTGPGNAHMSVGGGSAAVSNLAYFDDFRLSTG